MFCLCFYYRTGCQFDGGGPLVLRRERRARTPAIVIASHLPFSPSRHAMTSSSARTASSTGTTGRASKTNCGNMEQNLCTVSGSSQSTNRWPPQSPTRSTKNDILKLAGAFH
jgi:hypothetical protein